MSKVSSSILWVQSWPTYCSTLTHSKKCQSCLTIGQWIIFQKRPNSCSNVTCSDSCSVTLPIREVSVSTFSKTIHKKAFKTVLLFNGFYKRLTAAQQFQLLRIKREKYHLISKIQSLKFFCEIFFFFLNELFWAEKGKEGIFLY